MKKEVIDVNQLNLIPEFEAKEYICTEEQKKFIELDDRVNSVILKATAGSGKTFTAIQRMKKLIERGVDPSKIIFFSFTKAATVELQNRIGREDIKITTIHAFALGLLSRMKKYMDVITIFDFIKWYKETYTPPKDASRETKDEFYELISNMYDDADYISSEISAFKLQSADGIKCLVPDYYNAYRDFLRNVKSRDFADMLIEVRDLLKEDKWLKMFRGQYDYIFIDEYQDTSAMQMQILLALNAKFYYIIGDVNQAIFGFSGSNCSKIEQMLKDRRKTIYMSLSVNFRSDQKIIENSNKFSNLKATANSKEDGFVKRFLLFKIDSEILDNGKKMPGLIEVMNFHDEIVVLVRTNAAIRDLEFELLKRKAPIKYFNYIKDSDIKEYRKGNVHINLTKKFNKLKKYFNSEEEILTFIETHKSSKKFITTIHKSKGREFDYCVVVNSIDPGLLKEIGLYNTLTEKQRSKLTFDLTDEKDFEERNVHYVAVSRSKHGVYYMIYDK